jgi:ABC-type lipoprotein release transport system permease subunit
MILISMGLLIALGLSIGLISPLLGASAGFGVGAALCLRLPDIPDQLRRRLLAVTLGVVYTMALLFVATPAGVLTGAVVPMLMVGFADEYAAWKWARTQQAEASEGKTGPG